MLRRLILSVFSGIILALPFCCGGLWLFAWLGFIPLFFAIQNESKAKAFLLSYISGVIFWSTTVYWLVHVTLPGTILLILYLALYFGIFGFFTSSQLTANSFIFLIPSIWVLLEYVRSYLFTGFPWALLGYSQYLNLPVIQISDLTGAWGVSFLIMLVNVAIYKMIKGRRIIILAPAILLVLTLVYGFYKLHILSSIPQASSIRISVIQANIPQELKWDAAAKNYIFDRYAVLTKKAAKETPDLIVWPEAANPDIVGEEDYVFKNILSLSEEIKIPLLLGSVIREGKKYFNSALLLNNQGKITERYDKLHLVPFGEYIPLKKFLPFLQAVVPIGDIDRGTQYTLFKLSALSSQPSVKFSVLICFEDLFPELSRRFAKKGAEFLVNITNDAWYKQTTAPYQHLQASVFRAIENRLALVRSANTGVSAFIAPSGKIISTVKDQKNKEIFVSGYETKAINIAQRRESPYTRFGDFFIFLLSFFWIYSIFRLRK